MTREELLIILFCVCASLGFIIYLVYKIICIEEELSDALKEIKKLGKESKAGKWLPYFKEGLKWKCSECDSRFTTPFHYCPNCGIRMEEEE